MRIKWTKRFSSPQHKMHKKFAVASFTGRDESSDKREIYTERVCKKVTVAWKEGGRDT